MPYTPRPHPEAPRRSRADELDYPSEPTGLYALADDLRRDPRVLPRSQEFEREIGKVGALRKVRTTLGRWRSDPARATPPHSSARVAAALQPALLPRGGVRVVDDHLPGSPQPRRRRWASFCRLRPLVARESLLHRAAFTGIAVLFAAASLAAMLSFWAPASAAPDENAAILAGRLLARNGTVRLVPADSFAFVSSGWIAVPGEGTGFLPAGPLGLSVAYAILFSLAPSAELALTWVHLVSPVAAALAILGMFYLGRFAGGSFLGALAMLAAAPYLLEAGAGPGIDAPALALSVWGMVLLLSWWRCDSPLGLVLGLTSGLLLGCAAAVRGEMLVLSVPLLLACAFAWHWRRPVTSLLRIALPLIGWAMPICGLIYVQHRLTGTAAGPPAWAGVESLQSLHSIAWQPLLEQLRQPGIHFLVPLGVMGLLALVARRLRLGLVIMAWGVLVMLAACITWPQGAVARPGFPLAIIPPLMFGVAYLLRRVIYAPSDAPPSVALHHDSYTGEPFYAVSEPPVPLWRQVASPLAAGLLVMGTAVLGVNWVIAPPAQAGLNAAHARAANLAELGRHVRRTVPEGSTLFMDTRPGAAEDEIHHVQVAGDFQVFDATVFTGRFARDVRAVEAGGPADPAKRRFEYLLPAYAGLDDEQLSTEVERIINGALSAGRSVFLIMNAADSRLFQQAHLARAFEFRTVAIFQELLPQAPHPLAGTFMGAEWLIIAVTPQPTVRAPVFARFGGGSWTAAGLGQY